MYMYIYMCVHVYMYMYMYIYIYIYICVALGPKLRGSFALLPCCVVALNDICWSLAAYCCRHDIQTVTPVTNWYEANAT